MSRQEATRFSHEEFAWAFVCAFLDGDGVVLVSRRSTPALRSSERRKIAWY